MAIKNNDIQGYLPLVKLIEVGATETLYPVDGSAEESYIKLEKRFNEDLMHYEGVEGLKVVKNNKFYKTKKYKTKLELRDSKSDKDWLFIILINDKPVRKYTIVVQK